MKKFLALALVLGVVGLTNASIAGLQISVNGNQHPQDLEYKLLPSQTLILDIWTDAAIQGDAGTYALIVLQSQGSIAGGASQLPSYPGIWIMDNAAGPDLAMPIPAGTNGVGLGVTVFALAGEAPIAAGTKIFDGIVFHCAGPDDAVIQLWNITGNWTLGEMVDQVVIDQIPEPITMLLLGLGGLFIRKR